MTSHIRKLFPHLDGKFPEGRNPPLLKDKPSTSPLYLSHCRVPSRYSISTSVIA